MGKQVKEKIGKPRPITDTKDFRWSFFQKLDTKFFLILILSIIAESIIVSIFASRPVDEYSKEEVIKIQKQFASFILKEEAVKDETAFSSRSEGSADVSEDEGTSETGENDSAAESKTASEKSSEGERIYSGGRTSAEARRKAIEKVSREVSSKGILGLLTGSGETTASEGVLSIFNGRNSGSNIDEDLDALLTSVDGLRTLKGSGESGTGGSGSAQGRRTRSNKRVNIDDLVSDDDGYKSESFKSKGELKIETAPESAGDGQKRQYRSAESLQEILMSHNKAVKYCYERELKRYPSLRGKIIVRITVNSSGQVVKASIVSSTLNNERVERCILARINNWKDFKKIDESGGDVTFRQTYIFGH